MNSCNITSYAQQYIGPQAFFSLHWMCHVLQQFLARTHLRHTMPSWSILPSCGVNTKLHLCRRSLGNRPRCFFDIMRNERWGVVVVTLGLGGDPMACGFALIPEVRGGWALIGSQQIILTGKRGRLSLVLPVLTQTHAHILTDQAVVGKTKTHIQIHGERHTWILACILLRISVAVDHRKGISSFTRVQCITSYSP